jgi:ABC-type sugar transport system permease subunit
VEVRLSDGGRPHALGYVTAPPGQAAARREDDAATRRRERLWRLQRRLAPYLFVSPFVVLFCCFMLYPLLRSVVLSTYKAVGPNQLQFVGLGNFKFVLTDKVFWAAVANTTYFTVLFLTLQIPMALALAVMLNSRRLRMRNFFRFAFFSSHLVGNVFVAVIFGMLLAQRHGLINKAIGLVLPWIGPELNWFGDPKLAMPAVVLAALWISLGYAMVYFLAALQSVDRELYEAAEVDGASKWQQFRHVTLPGIRPVLVFMILVGTIGGYQLFELPYVLFYGVWTNYAITIVIYLFQMGFEAGDIGYASAIGWMLVAIIFVISLVQLKVTRAREDVS